MPVKDRWTRRGALGALSASALVVGSPWIARAQEAIRGVSDDEVVIGSINDLSGPTATTGVNNSQALRLAFDEANARGGIHGRLIRFVVEDSQYQVPRAVQALNKMLSVDEIFLITNNGGTPLINANLPSQIENNIPSLFPLSEARSMYEPFERLKFNLFASYIDQVRAGVAHFASQEGKSRIGIMYQDTDYGREVLTGLQEQAAAMDLEIAGETAHDPADTDFNAFLQRLRAAECDLIVLGTAVRDTALILGTARKMGWNVEFMGVRPTYDNAVAATPGGVAEGFYAISPAIYAYPDDPRPEVQDFARRYHDRWGIDSSFVGQVGYGSGQIILTALEQAGRDLTVDSFIAALEGIRDFRSIFEWSPISFGPDDHNGTNEAWLSVVRDGRWSRVLDEPLSY